MLIFNYFFCPLQLALRTVNSSRSAYACFLFAPSFFLHYDDGAEQISSQDSDDTLRCKIAMKVGLTLHFNNPHLRILDHLKIIIVTHCYSLTFIGFIKMDS